MIEVTNDKNFARNILILFIVLGILGILYFYYLASYKPRSEFNSIKAGMSRQEVYKKLGTPFKIVKKGEKLITANYEPVPKFKNRNVILEYSKSLYLAYIFIDENDKVFAVVVAGT